MSRSIRPGARSGLHESRCVPPVYQNTRQDNHEKENKEKEKNGERDLSAGSRYDGVRQRGSPFGGVSR